MKQKILIFSFLMFPFSLSAVDGLKSEERKL